MRDGDVGDDHAGRAGRSGPLLGGWITDNISWPWIFYINMPVGIVAAGVTWSIYRTRETPTRKLPIDCVGLGLLVLWVGALQIMLDKGKELDWFALDRRSSSLAVVAVVGFAFFLVWELTDEHPVVDLRLFARRNFWTGTLATVARLRPVLRQRRAAAAVAAAVHGLHRDRGRHGAGAGRRARDHAVADGRQERRARSTRAASRPSRSSSSRWCCGCARTSTRRPTSATLMIPTIIQGAAMAFFFIPLVTHHLSGLDAGPHRRRRRACPTSRASPPARSARRSSTTLWENRAALHHAQLAEQRSAAHDAATTQALAALQARPASRRSRALAQLNRLVDQQAFMLAANDIFYVSALLFLLLIAVVWLARPAKGPAQGGEAAPARTDVPAGDRLLLFQPARNGDGGRADREQRQGFRLGNGVWCAGDS